MKSIKSWIQESQSKRVIQMANDFITLSDFDNKLYIAFQGNPLVSVDDNLTSTEIVQKLSEARSNFINARLNYAKQ